MQRLIHHRTLTAALLGTVAAAAASAFICTSGAAPGLSRPAMSTVAATARAATPEPTVTPIVAYPRQASGFAISSPQCGATLPPPPFDFAIVGVTDGRAFRPNACLGDEFRWAAGGRLAPSVYVNTNFDPTLRPDIAMVTGAACGQDAACAAYLYGAASANYAAAYAASQGVTATRWWLDVQIASTWSADERLNALAIRGAIDHLAARGLRVGISSTPYQWAAVAGDAAPGLPGWVAGAAGPAQAATYCAGGQDFAGGRTEQIAYVAGGFERVLACGPAPARGGQ